MIQQPEEVRDYIQVKIDVLKDFGITPEPDEFKKLAGCTTFSSSYQHNLRYAKPVKARA